ncbi:hypothetical protein PHPALM_31572 [Phytophthora palmivora]|uniref:Uncharacterized protein n=1 Tax=Phytophthora palmivora TaxID=4796 RepID=A0A2P4X288_9STRA|nr:hypothetical protein PHPALM_31572 [Phytophthora palmivora]
MASDVVGVIGYGVEALLQNWKLISLCHPDIDIKLVRLENGPGDSVVATTRAFMGLASRLLGQKLVMNGCTHLIWDNEAKRVVNIQYTADLLAPMLQLLGNLEDVVKIKISMGWKAVESEEYESSAPAVQAHFHAVRAEEALRRDDYVQAEKEGHLASEKFLQAAQRVSDKRTIDALVLLAENYEYRAKVARARNPRPIETEEKTREETPIHTEDKRELITEQKQTEVEAVDPREAQKAETQLNVAAAEMEELWRRLNEIGLSSPGSAEKNYYWSGGNCSGWRLDTASSSGVKDEKSAPTKMEIVRLLNTVKTLSSENTKLVKKCEALTNVQAENREIRESMDLFKKDYNQKLVMIKRALEEWRRQRNNVVLTSPLTSDAGGSNSALENKLKMQEEQIAKLMEEARIKDDRIAKYDKWYKTLKAGAKAKQLSQSHDSRNGANSFSTSSSFVQNGGGSLSGPSNSFTNSGSFHGYSPGSAESAGISTPKSLTELLEREQPVGQFILSSPLVVVVVAGWLYR